MSDASLPRPEVRPGRVRTSTFCAVSGCVGVVVDAAGVTVVDTTKDATQTPLRFTREEWAAFVAGVKNGEFDLEGP